MNHDLLLLWIHKLIYLGGAMDTEIIWFHATDKHVELNVFRKSYNWLFEFMSSSTKASNLPTRLNYFFFQLNKQLNTSNYDNCEVLLHKSIGIKILPVMSWKSTNIIKTQHKQNDQYTLFTMNHDL